MKKDIELIRKRYVDGMLSASFKDEERLFEIKSHVTDGSKPDCIRFDDIDYSSDDPNTWYTPGHLRYLCDLAVIYLRDNTCDKDEVKSLISRGLNEWIKNDYIHTSWWHSEINVPWAMSDFCILAWELLTPEQKKWCDIIMSRGSMRVNYSVHFWTGANLTWGANTSVKHAVLLGDEEYLGQIADRLYKEIDYGREGIQPDGTFFQHGPKLYVGGYGRNFISGSIGLLKLLDGTAFALSERKRDILESFLIDGVRWMIHRDMFDWTACGREFSRHEWGGASMVAGSIREYLTLSLPKRRAELEEMRDAIFSNKTCAQGVKYFPACCLMTAHLGDIYIGFRGISNKTTASGEVCGDEGGLSANMAYGTSTCVMNSGKEYYEISPVWNFCRVPGTTTRDETDEELFTHAMDGYRLQTGDRFDGSQLGDCAYSAQTVEHNGIRATVVAFGTPWGVAILGSGISSDRDETLTTTVEQCFLCGEYTATDDLVVHDGVKYVNLDKQNKFVTVAEHRTGSWKRNNTALSDAPVEADVFEVTLTRGHDGYAYLISPEDADERFEVLENTEDVQALRIPDGRVFIHFFAESEYVLPDGRKVSGHRCECKVLDK